MVFLSTLPRKGFRFPRPAPDLCRLKGWPRDGVHALLPIQKTNILENIFKDSMFEIIGCPSLALKFYFQKTKAEEFNCPEFIWGKGMAIMGLYVCGKHIVGNL